MTVLILGLIALIAMPLFVQSTRFYLMNRTRTELQQEARQSLSLITKNVRQARSTSIVISRDAGQPYYSRITFTRIDGVTLMYRQSGGNLIETVGARNQVIADNLRFLCFAFPRSDDMTILSVDITLEKGIYEGKTKALHVASERVRVMS